MLDIKKIAQKRRMKMLDIKKIATDKIQQLHDSGELENKICEGIEKTIFDAIQSATSSYSFEKSIKEEIISCLGTIPEALGLKAYQRLLEEKTKEYANRIIESELANKAAEQVNKLLIKNYAGISIEDLYEEFKETMEDVVCDEINDLGTFIFDIQEQENYYAYDDFHHYVLSIGKSEKELIQARFMFYKETSGKEELNSLIINGKKASEIQTIYNLTNFEQKMLNIYLNKTKINFPEECLRQGHFDTEF